METTLKGITSFSLLILVLLSFLFFIWWTEVSYVQNDFIGEVCRPEIKAAIYKMGPKYNYLMKGEVLEKLKK